MATAEYTSAVWQNAPSRRLANRNSNFLFDAPRFLTYLFHWLLSLFNKVAQLFFGQIGLGKTSIGWRKSRAQLPRKWQTRREAGTQSHGSV